MHMRVDGAWGSFYSTNQGTFGLDGLPGGKFGKFDCAPLGTTKPLKSPNKLSQALRMLDAGHYTKYLIVEHCSTVPIGCGPLGWAPS